mmetsp:Transcript_25425/g.39213  ORF Transcript_25425/g.39213 Transcript_25425/m.39213 type:complete len:156 (-) Transcript_25425:2609-3076(-)
MRRREEDTPVGLKNIGNTCYFNSILQVYFNLPDFVSNIMKFEDTNEELAPLNKDDVQEKNMLNRLNNSRKLITNLKTLFARLTIGNKKYADPTDVLRSTTNEQGSTLEIGDQQDIGEFNGQFLLRVQEGLNYKKLYEEYVKQRKEEEAKAVQDVA